MELGSEPRVFLTLKLLSYSLSERQTHHNLRYEFIKTPTNKDQMMSARVN